MLYLSKEYLPLKQVVNSFI